MYVCHITNTGQIVLRALLPKDCLFNLGLSRMSDQKANDNLEDKISFIMKLGTALHRHGAPAHRLERLLNNIAISQDIKGEFFCTPTAIMASFLDRGHRQSAMSRTNPGGINLRKTIELDKVAFDLYHGNIILADADKAVDEINTHTVNYPKTLEILSYALVSMGAGFLLGGGLYEMVFSFVVGLSVGLVAVLSQANESLTKVFESLSAIVAYIIASGIFYFLPIFSSQIVIIAGLIVLIPGLTLTIAIEELSTQNLVAGTARMMQALIAFFKIAFGLIVASQLVNLFSDQQSIQELSRDIPIYFIVIAFSVIPLAFTVLFNARLKDAVWIYGACYLSLLCAQLIAANLGPEPGAFISALLIASASNYYSRTQKKPAAVMLLPGLLLLVPGSIGFKGINSLIEQDTLTGLNLSFEMFIVAVSLVAGILFANILVPSKRSL